MNRLAESVQDLTPATAPALNGPNLMDPTDDHDDSDDEDEAVEAGHAVDGRWVSGGDTGLVA